MADQTFLFADLAGFTAMTEAHGDEDAADLAEEFCRSVRDLLPEYDAEQVKTIGDAVMVRCHDAARAVELGLRIISDVGGRPGFPVVRVGMNTGEATERDGDWFGGAVNVAARVSAAAGGNEVLLTESTYRAASAPAGVRFARHGEHRLRNVHEPVRLYSAVREGEQDAGLPIDPVCRMAVDVATGAGHLRFEGRTYHFCSLECARAFSADPASYA